MLWYPLRTDKATRIMQEAKQFAIDTAQKEFGLINYQVREIRPEDLPTPSTTNFTITIAANNASVTINRRVNSQSLVIICGIFAPDVRNNRDGITEGVVGQPILHRLNASKGTELVRRWPLCPVFASEDGAMVTEGYLAYRPDDVINIQWFAKETKTVDQVSQAWYMGVTLLPPGGTVATEAVD